MFSVTTAIPPIYAQTTPTDTPTAISTTPTQTPGSSNSQTPTPTGTSDNSQSEQDLLNQINDLQGKISDLQGQAQTLTSQIAVMDNTIKLTQYRIEATNEQIDGLKHDIAASNTEITKLNSSVDQLAKALMSRIVATYEVGNIQSVELIATADNMNNYVTQQSYLKIVQEHDKKLLYDLDTAKNDYATQKQYFANKQTQMEALQAQLQQYTDDLATQKQSKQELLTQTQGSEANYQRLLAQAQAQLAGFSNFTESQGGASLLSGQTVCDGWGCYYNQRDSQWGASALNHTQYTVASDGCLLTSVAMVMTHYGKHVTPADINNNPSNFASYFPAYLLYTVSANGSTAQRFGTAIDAHLASGDPVIVGIRYASGDTHFVVFVSGSNGNYTINDPYIENGHNINFTDHYSMGMIFEVDGVSVS